MKECAIGIDQGGTNTRIALIDREGTIIACEVYTTPANQPSKAIIQLISNGVEAILEKTKYPKDRVHGIGLGSAGFLSPQKGIIYFSPNIPTLANLSMTKLLEEETGFKTCLENDANAAAIGEHWLGAGRGVDNFIFITLGTGLGSGIILHGEIWHGTYGFAGEMGHTILFPDGLPCKCGRKGCLEAYCSASAIVYFTHEKLKQGKASSLREVSTVLTSQIIFQHASTGDSLALEVFKEIGTYLGIALSNVFNLLDLEMAIIGGKVAEAGDFILRPARDEVKRIAISSKYHTAQVVKSKLGENAGVLGSAFLVFQNIM